MNENSNAYDQYMEKRNHDAASFYTKASIDLREKTIAEFLLWEVRITSHVPSVHEPLA